MKKYALCLLAVMGLSSYAHAAFMVEPYLGYEMGEDPDTANSDVKATHIGIRLGGSTLGFMYGFEYDTYSGDYEVGSAKVDLDGSDLGGYVGYNFPVLFNVRLSYFLVSKADVGSSEFEGNGMKIGIGFTGLPFVNINLDRITRTYDEQDGASISDSDIESYMLSVSLPLP